MRIAESPLIISTSRALVWRLQGASPSVTHGSSPDSRGPVPPAEGHPPSRRLGVSVEVNPSFFFISLKKQKQKRLELHFCSAPGHAVIWIGMESESHFLKGLLDLGEVCKDSNVNRFSPLLFLFCFLNRENSKH